METLPETRALETPAVQTSSHSDVISSACRDMLELRTNGVLDVEKIKSWIEAQEQLECLSMRQLYGVLERISGCKKGATRAERAGDIVRWLHSRPKKPGRRVT